MSDLKEFAVWKGYPLPALNADGQFDKEWLHREWVAFRAGLARRAVPQANAEQDALRWRTFEKALHSRLQGPAHGKKIKVVEVCPMYGDEKEVSNITVLIDAAIRAASNATRGSDHG